MPHPCSHLLYQIYMGFSSQLVIYCIRSTHLHRFMPALPLIQYNISNIHSTILLKILYVKYLYVKLNVDNVYYGLIEGLLTIKIYLFIILFIYLLATNYRNS